MKKDVLFVGSIGNLASLGNLVRTGRVYLNVSSGITMRSLKNLVEATIGTKISAKAKWKQFLTAAEQAVAILSGNPEVEKFLKTKPAIIKEDENFKNGLQPIQIQV
jgi:hypothetical protein